MPAAKYRLKFNPNHAPAGSSQGGQFTSPNLAVADAAHLQRYMDVLLQYPDYHPNIAGLKVAGKSIFNPDKNLGLSRAQMPQIPTAAREDFLSTVPHTMKEVDPSTLYPIQNEIDGYKTAKYAVNPDSFYRPPLVSSDNYIIDGHHNWSSEVVKAVLTPGSTMKINAIDLPRDELLAHVHEYAQAHGFAAKPIYKFNPNHAPAGSPDGGQFTSGQGDSYNIEDLMVTDSDHGGLHARLAEDAVAWRNSLPLRQQLAISDYQQNMYAHMNAISGAYPPSEDLPEMKTIGDYAGAVAAVNEINKRADMAYGYQDPVASYNEARDLEQALKTAPEVPDGTTLYRVFRDHDLAAAASDALVGVTKNTDRFLSTTAKPYQAYKWGQERIGDPDLVLLRLTTKDAHGAYLTWGAGSSESYEYEVLFNRNTPMTITGVTPIHQGGVLIDATIGSRK